MSRVEIVDMFKVADDRPPGDDDLPWYYPLEGDIRKAQTAWDSTLFLLPC